MNVFCNFIKISAFLLVYSVYLCRLRFNQLISLKETRTLIYHYQCLNGRLIDMFTDIESL